MTEHLPCRTFLAAAPPDPGWRGWHDELARLARPIVAAMHAEALQQPYLCTDATGVLVQAPTQCRHGHFWVLVAPGLHVLFQYSAKHDKAAVDRLLPGYEGVLVADAHSVYHHLFADGRVQEAGCWSTCGGTGSRRSGRSPSTRGRRWR